MKSFQIFGLIGCFLLLSSPSAALDFSFNSGGGATSLNYSLTNADIAAGGKVVDTIDANSITFPSPTVFNRSATSNHYTGSGCTPTDYDDMTVGWGHNLSNLFTRVNASYAASLFGMESNFCVSNRPSVEFYWRSIDTAGVVRSHLEATGAHNGTFGNLGLYGNEVNWYTFSGAPVTNWMKWDFSLTNPILDLFTHNGLATGNYSTIRNMRNNAAWLQQRNAADTAYLSYPYYDATNRWVMAPSQSPTLWQPTRATATSRYIDIAGADTPTSGDFFFFVQPGAVTGFLYPFYISGSATQGQFFDLVNTSTNASAHAAMELVVNGTTAGDPFIRFSGAGTGWAAGVDNSDTDAFVIAASASLGSSNRLRLSTTGAITLAGNCTSSAAPAVCADALAGSVVIAAAGTAVTVNTTAVTANSQILIMEDSSLGTKLGVTCNTTIARTYAVTARTAATSFGITTSAAPVTNPACLSYLVLN